MASEARAKIECGSRTLLGEAAAVEVREGRSALRTCVVNEFWQCVKGSVVSGPLGSQTRGGVREVGVPFDAVEGAGYGG